jgi:Protein of unknown function (DUF2378)
VNDPPPSLVLPAPDPSAARYSVIPQRAASAVRFPTLAQYLEKLPKGLESHAALRVKGAIVRRLILDPVHALPLGVGLPEVLEGLVRAPPSANDWAPTVQLFSLHAAMFDSAFAGKGGTRAYEEWTFERDLRLFKTDAFRALVAVEGPERLLTNYAARWSAFHRGTTLNVMHVSKAKVAIRLSYPAHSWPPISCLALAGAFRAAVVVAGAKEGEVTFTDDSPAASSFDISWR